ncbi:MAG: hypothetical protein K0S28_1838 [Paucimonas sp.]|nr:hypothetical protein [Paucimonas sp.]
MAPLSKRGPLSRSEVAAVAQVTGVSTRTIALSPSDSETGELPGHILAVGLSIEEEARQVAQWTSIAQPSAKVYAVSTGSAWQKRAAKAYAAQAKILDLNVQAVEIPYGEGYLSGEAMEQLRKQLHASSSPLIFAALDASQTIQLRTAIGPDVPIYGTSQLNPRVLADWKTLAPINELDGVRLLDMPWQLQPDHLAVMVYPKPVPEPDRRRSADMERLYALGIDAYRVAHELAQGRSNVTIDGVTGRMSVRVDTLHPFFERLSQQAVYQNGAVAPLSNPSPTFK